VASAGGGAAGPGAPPSLAPCPTVARLSSMSAGIPGSDEKMVQKECVGAGGLAGGGALCRGPAGAGRGRCMRCAARRLRPAGDPLESDILKGGSVKFHAALACVKSKGSTIRGYLSTTSVTPLSTCEMGKAGNLLQGDARGGAAEALAGRPPGAAAPTGADGPRLAAVDGATEGA